MKLKLGERYNANKTMFELGLVNLEKVVPQKQMDNVCMRLLDVHDGYMKELPEDTNSKLILDCIQDSYILGRLHERDSK